jgi:hypothetical protein
VGDDIGELLEVFVLPVEFFCHLLLTGLGFFPVADILEENRDAVFGRIHLHPKPDISTGQVFLERGGQAFIHGPVVLGVKL